MSEALRVLIAEDSEDDAAFILHELQRGGYEPFTFRVDTAESMNKALDTIEWDIVLSDYVMPKFSGSTALKLLQAKGIDIPFILVSGKIGEETAVAMMKAGAHDYVMKENLKRLVPAIRRELDEAEVRRERRRADRALRESEQRLREAQALGKMGNWEFDIDTQKIEWSDEVYKLYERDKALGPPTAEEESHYYAPEQAEKLREFTRLAVENGQDFKYDLTAKLPSGKTIFLHATMHPVEDERGRVVKLFGTVQDITERKKAGEEIQLKAHLLDSAGDMIYLQDLAGKIIYANDAACKSHGYTRDEVMQMNIRNLLTPERAEMVSPIAQETLEKGDVKFETQHVCKDGTLMPVEVYSRLIKLGDGYAIIGVGRDITERKRAENELKASEAKFRTLFENAPMGIGVISLDGKPIELNTTAVTMAGFKTKEEMMASPIISCYVHPEDRERYIELFRKGKVRDFEAEMKRVDGSTFWISLSSSPYIDRSGEKQLISTVQDITERKRAEEELKHDFDIQSTVSSILGLSLKDISLDELAQNALDALLSIPWLSLGSDGCIFLVEDKPDVLIMKAKRGLEEAIQCGCAAVPFGKCLCGKAAESQKIIYAESGDERHEIQAAKMMAHEHYCVPVVFGGKTLGVVNVYLKEGRKRDKKDDDFLTTAANTLSVIIMRKRAQQELVESLSKLRKTVEESVQAMAAISEVRDPYTAGHQRRVAELSVAIAKEMGLTGEQLESIRVAASIHDIGKMQIPAEILSKPARLTEPEFSLIKAHPQVGYEIIKTIDFPWPVAQITLQHHERINGSGYPAHLTGKEIMPEACIMAVADVVEAMMTHRPYRAALGVDKALDEITENKGVLYDSDVVDSCVKLFRENKFQL